MYLLWLYHHRNLDSTSPDEAINLKDITSVLNKVNQSLSKANEVIVEDKTIEFMELMDGSYKKLKEMKHYTKGNSKK